MTQRALAARLKRIAEGKVMWRHDPSTWRKADIIDSIMELEESAGSPPKTEYADRCRFCGELDGRDHEC